MSWTGPNGPKGPPGLPERLPPRRRPSHKLRALMEKHPGLAARVRDCPVFSALPKMCEAGVSVEDALTVTALTLSTLHERLCSLVAASEENSLSRFILDGNKPGKTDDACAKHGAVCPGDCGYTRRSSEKPCSAKMDFGHHCRLRAGHAGLHSTGTTEWADYNPDGFDPPQGDE